MFDSLFPKEWTTLQRLMWLKTNALARAVYEIVTGNPVSFTAKAAPLRKLEVAFSPVQAGSGDPSPDNVRPISGWDSLNVEQYGGNLADPNALVAGYINNSGEIAGQNQTQLEYSSDFIPMPPNTQRITVGYNGYESGEVAWMGVALYDKNKDFLQRTANTTSTWKYTAYVAGRNAAYFRFTARTFGHGLDKMFCGIGDVSEFTPFTGHRSISITLGQTVYSGYADVVTGVLTDKTVQSVTLDGTGWSTGTISGKTVFQRSRPSTIKSAADFISNYVTRVSSIGASTPANSAYLGSSYINVYCPNLTLEQWTALLNTAPIQFVRIDTPKSSWVEHQLTPQEVSSLLGENNMWSDANGDLTVEYRSN